MRILVISAGSSSVTLRLLRDDDEVLAERDIALTLDAVSRALPDVPAVACFDTALHATLPAAAT